MGGGLVLVLCAYLPTQGGQAQGPRIRSTPPLVPTKLMRLYSAAKNDRGIVGRNGVGRSRNLD